MRSLLILAILLTASPAFARGGGGHGGGHSSRSSGLGYGSNHGASHVTMSGTGTHAHLSFRVPRPVNDHVGNY